MNLVEKIKVALKCAKLLKSSGKGVAGVSKTVVGLAVIGLATFGYEPIAHVLKGNEVEIGGVIQQVVQVAGIVVALWGKIAAQIKLEQAEK